MLERDVEWKGKVIEDFIINNVRLMNSNRTLKEILEGNGLSVKLYEDVKNIIFYNEDLNKFNT